MTKNQIIKKLVDYKNQITKLPEFFGKAELKDKITSIISFLRRYKTESKIEVLLFKEAGQCYAKALRRSAIGLKNGKARKKKCRLLSIYC